MTSPPDPGPVPVPDTGDRGPLVVYTCIFGPGRDRLRPVPPPAPGPGPATVYHAYVDDPDATDPCGWSLHPARWPDPDPRRRARRHKLLAHELHPAARASLWLDGCLSPRHDPAPWAGRLLSPGDPGIFVFRHPERTCVYQEAEACLRLRKDRPPLVRAQAGRYRAEGYPHHAGMVETGAVLRWHSPATDRFNRVWWAELSAGSLRDQLSFNYSVRKAGVRYGLLPGLCRSSPDLLWSPH